ncbi:MAG: LytTR family transcriptional regulator DNA-binding domain-containing protein [Lachnospiraceae bacterium]|nr:LytTR family transcriptional regulator DNA-binding domain-containing protein [Lachnospiraceae bacterium]
MISIIICDPYADEAVKLEKLTRTAVAKLGDEKGDFAKVRDREQLCEWMDKTDILDCAYIDVTEDGGIAGAEDIRARYPSAHILVIADMQSSPIKYLKPSIMASALVLRPINEDEADRTIKDLLKHLLGDTEDIAGQLTLETKEGITKIPYSKICYVEARMKKVYYRLDNVEYGCYDTLDNIGEKLPKDFVRCHRSFIVNTKKISRILAAQNLIQLDNEMSLPLSRSYKAYIKELLNGR